MTLPADRLLLHYRIVETLGQGGMGVVYVAEDTKLGRRIALKVLPAEVADDPDRRARFEREARAVAALNHANIVTLHSIEEHEGIHFLTMELIDGPSLDRVLTDDGLPLDRFFAIAVPLAEALARAHAQGIVHRDIKAANIVLSEDGVPKILDFGLAKMAHEPPGEACDSLSPTQLTTRAGAVMGTPAYMAPEQFRGLPADPRSDVFSLGTVLYEMLSGSRPFQRASDAASREALLEEAPDSLQGSQRGVPRDLASIVDRCLAKDPADRFASATELHAELLRISSRHDRQAIGLSAILRRPRVAIPLAASVALLLGLSGWWYQQYSSIQRIRTEDMPRIETLLEDGHHFEAYLLAYRAMQELPDDPAVQKLFLNSSIQVEVTTEPPGAEIWLTEYRETDGEWLHVGRSPLSDRLPAGYLKFRIEREGYETIVAASTSWRGVLHFDLVPSGSAPAGMLRVPAASFSLGGAEPLALPAHWIDRLEVTNSDFQKFVNAGGYDLLEHWQEAFEDGDRVLTFEDAKSRFVDSTGRPGPATWSVGMFPDGQGDYPVGGISWFEAMAYARWAGKSLPTLHHWRQAAGQGIFADILIVSNFGGQGPAPVGTYQGLGPYGTYDMAGNVWEWCRNRVGERRYSQGGAWNEPAYRFTDDHALSPWVRSPNLGFRCVRYETPPSRAATADIETTRFDFSTVDTMSDELFELVAERYQYASAELATRVEATDPGTKHWRRETVSFEAVYEGDRMLAHIFVPKLAEPPYQTVVFRPSSVVNQLTNVEDYTISLPVYILQSGRALVIPALWGTLERQGEGSRSENRVLKQVQDLRRTVDYLVTRQDIDKNRLAFAGLSAGGEYGPVYVAMEPRFQTAIFLAGGFHDAHMLGEPRDQVPWHFAPRVRVPTLMVNGENDFLLPLELAQKPMFRLLGTDPEHKRHVVLAGGHVPFDQNAMIRETLDWLDRYLGPVGKR